MKMWRKKTTQHCSQLQQNRVGSFFGYKNKYEALESDYSAQVTREVNIRPHEDTRRWSLCEKIQFVEFASEKRSEYKIAREKISES